MDIGTDFKTSLMQIDVWFSLLIKAVGEEKKKENM